MQKSVKPSKIRGIIKAPASKSMMQRAIAAALLSDSPVRILSPTYSKDSQAALEVIQRLGARVENDENEITVIPPGCLSPTGQVLNCGEAGLGIRMFTPIASLWHRPLTLTGEGSLLKRPVTMMEKPLQQLGVMVSTSGGCPPLTVTGPLKGGQAIVDGSVSSQFLTGLLMALPLVRKDSQLKVLDLKSTPYIDMTLSLLAGFGVDVEHENYETVTIKGGQRYSCGECRVEGDWSGAAFILAAGALGGAVTVTGLDNASPQADRRIVAALQAAGAEINMTRDTVQAAHKTLHAFRFDATHCPDLFPPLVALASNCSGTTIIEGVDRLVHKESNRAAALQSEFSKLGGVIRIQGNRMEVDGVRLKGGTIDSHNDHRIAMAGAIAAIDAESEVHIQDPECVAKSYPDFFADLQKIGAVVQ